MCSIHNRVRDIKRIMQELNVDTRDYVIDHKSNRHMCIIAGGRKFFTAKTTSDKRSILNLKSTLRRELTELGVIA